MKNKPKRFSKFITFVRCDVDFVTFVVILNACAKVIKSLEELLLFAKIFRKAHGRSSAEISKTIQ